MSKKACSLFVALTLAASCLSSSLIASAHADTFYFTYQGVGVTANGILTAGALDPANSLSSPAGFDITAITGVYNSSPITELLPRNTCCGVTTDSSGNIIYVSNNNILYYPSTAFLDAAGLAFADANGDVVNLFFGGDSYFALQLDGTFFEGTFTVATPIPAALPLMGTMLVAGYLVSEWRRRRRNGSAAPNRLDPAGTQCRRITVRGLSCNSLPDV